MSISKTDFNNIVTEHISTNVKSNVSYHAGNLPANLNTAYTSVYRNIADMSLRSPPTSTDIYASEAYNCIYETAIAHSTIRRVLTGIRKTDIDGIESTDNPVYAYSYLNDTYSINITNLCANIRQNASIYAGSEISRQKLINAVNGYSGRFFTLVNNAGTLDFRICHSSCHSNCHNSRSRR